MHVNRFTAPPAGLYLARTRNPSGVGICIIFWVMPNQGIARKLISGRSPPDRRLVVVPGICHSMNPEFPALYVGYFGAWFGDLSPTPMVPSPNPPICRDHRRLDLGMAGPFVT